MNIVTRQGGNELRFDAAYYAQPAGLTSQPVTLPCESCPRGGETGYERIRYRDATAHLGGPIVRDRLWFFLGYQYLVDADSQPGSDPEAFFEPRSHKPFWKINWQLAPRWTLLHSFHSELWNWAEAPTISTPFETTLRGNGWHMASTLFALTHVVDDATLWEVRLSGLRTPGESNPVTGDYTTPAHFDLATGVWSKNAPFFGRSNRIRDRVHVKLSHYATDFLGADHDFKFGVQFQRGQHWFWGAYPGDAIYYDYAGEPYMALFAEPFTEGGEFRTVGGFAEDVIRLGGRTTMTLGVRYDHSRAISPDVAERDARGERTGGTIRGLGTLYTWNVVSPRFGINVMLDPEGRTVLRAHYGRYYQGVLTAIPAGVHPGITPTTTALYDPETGGYTDVLDVFDPIAQSGIDPETRAPNTDQFSIGIDRQLGAKMAFGASYVHKRGRDFIGTVDTGGVYGTETRVLEDGRTVEVLPLLNAPEDRFFLATNRDDFFLRYDGLLMTFERRWSGNWQALVSYSLSRSYGLQGWASLPVGYGQDSDGGYGDPNYFVNAEGPLPDDRTHMFRVQGSVEVPKIGVLVGSNFQHLTGQPYGARAFVRLPQGVLPVYVEPRGTRRLSSQTLLDLRLSKIFRFGRRGRLEILVDVLNLLNDTAEEGIVTENVFSPNFAEPDFYVDPRRAMIGVKLDF